MTISPSIPPLSRTEFAEWQRFSKGKTMSNPDNVTEFPDIECRRLDNEAARIAADDHRALADLAETRLRIGDVALTAALRAHENPLMQVRAAEIVKTAEAFGDFLLGAGGADED